MIGGVARWWRSVRLPRPSAADWDASFARGDWAFLADRSESARLALVAHFVRIASPADAAIVDIGCGEGLLAEAIAHLPHRSYLGVDLSAVAIERASARASARELFKVADAATFTPVRPVDVIVLNEVLYYLEDIEGVVRRLIGALSPGGALVVSIYDKPKTRRLWREIARAAETVNSVSLSNAAGTRWRIALLRPR